MEAVSIWAAGFLIPMPLVGVEVVEAFRLNPVEEEVVVQLPALITVPSDPRPALLDAIL